MAIPQAVLAAGWIPFVVVFVLIVLFSFFYIRYFQSKYDKELCSTLSSMVALIVALLTCAIVPVDIFLVSFMKTSDGEFKEWAKNATDRESIMNGVLYAYYALYLAVMLLVFFVLPFAYFFYEEGDEDGQTSTKTRCCTSIKYTTVCILFALVLILVGAFAPWRVVTHSHNSTEDDDWKKKMENIWDDLSSTHGEDAISFSISILTILGYLLVIFYTGYGMSAWPMDLVKGRRNMGREREELEQSHASLYEQVQVIRRKYGVGERLSGRDARRVQTLEDDMDVLVQRQQQLTRAQSSCFRKCTMLLRPFEILIGVVFFLLAALVFLSLLLTNIDKILHSLGPKMGYILPERTLPNPLDIVLVFSQKVFPLDYILMTGLVLYFIFCSMGGISHMGIWFCCLRMYKIRPSRTKPQGLLFLVFLLSFIVLALNVLFYQIAPQYTMFGSQHYMANATVDKYEFFAYGNSTVTKKLVPCSAAASSDDCVMTRMTMLITRFCFKIWFFGAAYFWMSWGFLGIFLIGFLVSLIRKRRSAVEGSVDRDDMDSDEELIAP